MYTSGWPKIQKRCCQSTGWPPADGLKKLAPKARSNMSSMSATVMAGKARMISTEVTRVIQVKTGRRIMVMPLARMLMIVQMKLKEAASEAMPRIWMPMIQKSVPTPVKRRAWPLAPKVPESGA